MCAFSLVVFGDDHDRSMDNLSSSSVITSDHFNLSAYEFNIRDGSTIWQSKLDSCYKSEFFYTSTNDGIDIVYGEYGFGVCENNIINEIFNGIILFCKHFFGCGSL